MGASVGLGEGALPWHWHATMTDTVLPKSDQNLIWIDLEMTGLLPDHRPHHRDRRGGDRPQLTVRVEGPVFASTRPTPCSTAWTTGTRAPTARAA
jgi:hypothetical protein